MSWNWFILVNYQRSVPHIYKEISSVVFKFRNKNCNFYFFSFPSSLCMFLFPGLLHCLLGNSKQLKKQSEEMRKTAVKKSSVPNKKVSFLSNWRNVGQQRVKWQKQREAIRNDERKRRIKWKSPRQALFSVKGWEIICHGVIWIIRISKSWEWTGQCNREDIFFYESLPSALFLNDFGKGFSLLGWTIYFLWHIMSKWELHYIQI